MCVERGVGCMTLCVCDCVCVCALACVCVRMCVCVSGVLCVCAHMCVCAWCVCVYVCGIQVTYCRWVVLLVIPCWMFFECDGVHRTQGYEVIFFS